MKSKKSYFNKKKYIRYLFLLFINQHFFAHENNTPPVAQEKKSWTFMIYMAAANDLGVFAPRNLKQMQRIGSNEHINIVAQHNFNEKNNNVSRTFYITKGDKILLNENLCATDCGDAQTLIDFCCQTISKYPAEHYALIIWNHGTGALEPLQRSNLSIEELFSISRSLDFFEKNTHSFLNFPALHGFKTQHVLKGVCFNDSTGTFITEQQLCNALKTICATTDLPRKKFDILGFDACFMAMIETAVAVQPFADFMVGSQDVEPGTGWDYFFALFPFSFATITPEKLGAHLVHAYAKKYKSTKDFTQSCIILNEIEKLESNISHVAHLLHKLLKSPFFKKMLRFIKNSRNKHSCIHFNETDYIDLHNFYLNLLEQCNDVAFNSENSIFDDVAQLKKLLFEGMELIAHATHENMTGSDFANAKGVSIYFPEHTLHSSYKKTTFATSNNWFLFLKSYLLLSKK